MPAPAVVASGLRKDFRQPSPALGRRGPAVRALDGIDLEVAPGTIHGIIGPNGSGKSTCLRILATLVLADGGRATVAGHDVASDALSVRRSIGFTAGDERSVYWRLTARQNLEFAAALQHLDDAGGAIALALEQTNLTAVADQRASGFSQGMLRRLGLARAILHTPAALLLDEPTRSLDPLARGSFHDVVRDMQRHGTTTVIATHDLDEAATLCDTVSVFFNGRVVAQVHGATERALERTLRKHVS
jgi:ABC-2 type transport system ATP-binding protein